MKLSRIVRWEFVHAVRSKQFLLMTVLIPGIVAVAILGASSAGAFSGSGSSGPSTPPPPFLIALFLAVILFMGSFISGVMTMYGVVREKQSRVVEIVLSSVSPFEMMTGKILGLGMAGLLQVIAWSATAYYVASRFLPTSLASLALVHWLTYPIYFVLGYLFIASLYASVGAVMKDVQSGGATGLVGLIPYAPIAFTKVINREPGRLGGADRRLPAAVHPRRDDAAHRSGPHAVGGDPVRPGVGDRSQPRIAGFGRVLHDAFRRAGVRGRHAHVREVGVAPRAVAMGAKGSVLVPCPSRPRGVRGPRLLLPQRGQSRDETLRRPAIDLLPRKGQHAPLREPDAEVSALDRRLDLLEPVLQSAAVLL